QQSVVQPGVPVPAKPAAPGATPSSAVAPTLSAEARGETIRLSTDLVVADIDTLGGTLKRLELLRHKDSNDPDKNFVLISAAHHYEAQAGSPATAGPITARSGALRRGRARSKERPTRSSFA